MFEEDVTTLGAKATLAGAEEDVRLARLIELRAMKRTKHWCDLNSPDPQQESGAVPVSHGGDHLIQIGGHGTPEVAQLCFEELAIARRAGAIATENYAADVLDLVYRFPMLWAAVQRLELEGWAARKVARMARRLAKDRAAIVDAAVAAAVREAPSRLFAIAEAKIIEADPDTHRAKLQEDAKKTGVWLSKVRPGDVVDEITGEPATRRVTAKLPTGSAVRCDENVEDLAHAIIEHTEPDADGNVPTLADARLQAFEMLTTDPHAAAAFLDGLDQPFVDAQRDHSTNDRSGPTDGEPEPEPRPAPVPVARPRSRRRPAKFVVHLSAPVLCGCTPGVVRVEDLGPVLLEQLRDLLGEGREITVQPVIDLNDVEAVNGYEHPTRIAHRTILRTQGDIFPHSTSRGTKRLDMDHPTPYDPNGPPGQTGDLNAAPLTRRHHRAKTHRAYQLRQLGLGAYRWITPHGLCRLVTPNGTRDFEPIRGPDGTVIGEIYTGPRVEYAPRE